MESIFANNVLKILAFLFLNRQELIHQSKISELTGLRRIQVQRALKRLLDEEIIKEYKQGNMVCYKLQEDHPLLPDLKNILYKTILIVEPFKKAFEDCAEKIDLAFIYGSFASGSETAESDIDVLIVGGLGLKEVSKYLSPVAKQLQREINPVVYSKAEFLKKIERKDHFLTSVMSSKKIWIIGDNNELRKMEKSHPSRRQVVAD